MDKYSNWYNCIISAHGTYPFRDLTVEDDVIDTINTYDQYFKGRYNIHDEKPILSLEKLFLKLYQNIYLISTCHFSTVCIHIFDTTKQFSLFSNKFEKSRLFSKTLYACLSLGFDMETSIKYTRYMLRCMDVYFFYFTAVDEYPTAEVINKEETINEIEQYLSSDLDPKELEFFFSVINNIVAVKKEWQVLSNVIISKLIDMNIIDFEYVEQINLALIVIEKLYKKMKINYPSVIGDSKSIHKTHELYHITPRTINKRLVLHDDQNETTCVIKGIYFNAPNLKTDGPEIVLLDKTNQNLTKTTQNVFKVVDELNLFPHVRYTKEEKDYKKLAKETVSKFFYETGPIMVHDNNNDDDDDDNNDSDDNNNNDDDDYSQPIKKTKREIQKPIGIESQFIEYVIMNIMLDIGDSNDTWSSKIFLLMILMNWNNDYPIVILDESCSKLEFQLDKKELEKQNTFAPKRKYSFGGKKTKKRKLKKKYSFLST